MNLGGRDQDSRIIALLSEIGSTVMKKTDTFTIDELSHLENALIFSRTRENSVSVQARQKLALPAY